MASLKAKAANKYLSVLLMLVPGILKSMNLHFSCSERKKIMHRYNKEKNMYIYKLIQKKQPMKKFLQIVAVLVTAFLIHSTVSAQENAGITFSIVKKNGNLFTVNAQKQKVIDLYVTGLSSSEEVTAFITKFKAQEGVIDITISNDLVDNKRVATATFFEGAQKAFLKKVLINTGVQQIIVDGKTIKTTDIKTRDTASDSTN